MKRGLIFLLATQIAFAASAQEKQKSNYADSLLSRWCIDVNVMGGMLTQSMTLANTTGNYLNAVNANVGNIKFSNGSSFGADLQLGYFFGHKRNFGIGTGILYLSQQGDVSLDGYHMEFQSTDPTGKSFRQVISANNPIKEQQKINNFNIPLLLKYKKRFSEHWGLTADAGLLINLQLKNSYTTNASFNYEAIYQTSDGNTFTYDNAATPSSSDIFWTKSNYIKDNPNGNVQNYFNQLHANGYNVGLGVVPANNKGNVSYATGSVGFLISPAVSYYLSDNVALNVGVHYLYQPFKNTVSGNYQLTNKVGDYSSALSGVSSVNSQSYGINIGARFFFGKAKDTDGDGIPDKKDRCPLVFGLDKFLGCPDSDGDGIPDPDDSCPKVAGLVQFHGCPDSDGDGIPDKEDACPYEKGLAQFHGCPDRDGDGIPDKEDLCPDKPGPAKYHGCPDTDGDGIPDNEDQCPGVAGPASNHGCPIPEPPKPVEQPKQRVNLLTEVLFDEGKTTIKKSSYLTLDEAVEVFKNNPDAYIEIDGYTDNIGSTKYNKALSQKRASAVKRYLTEKGVNAAQIKAKGHGSKSPEATNKTKTGRAKNRRVKMKLSTRS